MKGLREYGPGDLQNFIVSGTFHDMTTHAIARKILADKGEPVKKYRVVESNSHRQDGGPVFAEYIISHENLLTVLERLAFVGGERLVIDQTEIMFFPD